MKGEILPSAEITTEASRLAPNDTLDFLTFHFLTFFCLVCPAMPVNCPVHVPRLTSQQFGSLDYRVLPVAFAIHNEIGCHWDEQVYHAEMLAKILDNFSNAMREVPLTVSFGAFIKSYRLDLLVDEMGVYELKTVATINKVHIGQVLNYLRLLNATRAKIINFRNHKVESKFVNSSDTLSRRRVFEIDSDEYRGPKSLCDTSIEMLRDLGTKLSNTLYTEYLVANIGRTEARRVWIDRNVFQKFDLVADDEAFVVTALQSGQCHYRMNLARMRQTARLKRFHWINVTPDIVKIESVE